MVPDVSAAYRHHRCAALGATIQFAASARSESAFWNGTRWKVALTA
jgi:hypothetical protein